MGQNQETMKSFPWILMAPCLSTLIGCGGIEGTYSGTDQGHFDKITILPKQKVELVFMGSTMEVDYKREGDSITVMAPLGNQVFALDDEGCLDGGRLMGKYCKE